MTIKNFYFNHHKHKFLYSQNLDGNSFRACKKCGIIEEYRENVPAYGSGWFRLVSYTKQGSKNLLERLKNDN
jgi:hypothetical protein